MSAVLAVELMVPVKVTGVVEESPMATHWVAEGQVTWVIEEMVEEPVIGNSDPRGPAGGPKRNIAPLVVPEVPTPVTRHLGVGVGGQTMEDTDVTVLVVGL